MIKKGEKVFLLILIGIFLFLFLAQFGFFQFTGNSILKFFHSGKAVDDPLIIPITECGVLDQEGATYVLQNDINSTESYCFSVEANNIRFDGGGHLVLDVFDSSVSAIPTSFIRLVGVLNSKIFNFTVEQFSVGAYLRDSHANVFNKNSFFNSSQAIVIEYSNDNLFLNNNLSVYGDGFYLANSRNNTFNNNFLSNSFRSSLLFIPSSFNFFL